MTDNVAALLEELGFEPSELNDNIYFHGPIAVRWVNEGSPADTRWGITCYENARRYCIRWEVEFGIGTPAHVIGAAIEAAVRNP